MFHRKLKFAAGAVVAAGTVLSLHAEMAQDPLLSRTAAVEPNIVFMFDDSGSMPATAIYQYGGTPGGMGMSGPGKDSTSEFLAAPTQIYGKSPDVNLIYYDPRVTYSRRIKADGSFQDPGSTSGITSFNVYFYRPPSSVANKVDRVTVDAKGSGYPATGVTATLSPPPTGGIQATASVQISSSPNVASVAVTNGGLNYPATGVTAAFSAPAAGGVQATGTVQMGTSGNVSSVTVDGGGKDYPSSGVSVTFSAPSTPGGVTATGTVQIDSTTLKVTAASVAARGSGYASGATIAFSNPPAGGTPAKATLAVTTTQTVTALTVATGGCYNTPPTVTIGNPPNNSNGTTATAGTVTMGAFGAGGCATNRRPLASITVADGGSGYTVAPTVTVSGNNAATVTASIGPTGWISGITLLDGGSGYKSAPTWTISGTGSGASFSLTTGTSRTISGITVTSGGKGYTNPPTITLGSVGSGTGASFTANLGLTNIVSGITVTNGGAGYTSTPTITLNNKGSGSGAAFAVTLGTTNVISAINVVDAGLGYVTTPTLSLSGVGSGVGASWTVVPAPYPVQAENRPWDGTGSATTTMDYFTKDSNYPSGYLPDSGGPLAVGATVIPYPNTASSSTAEYPKFKNRTDCGGETVKVCTWEQERQNYANWKTYHSTRLDLAKTGIGLAFQPLNPTFRLGWGTINTLESFSRLDSGVRTYNPAVQTDFLDWLYKVQAVGNTPNRIALDKVGQYYQRSDDNGPWADAPTGDKPVASSAAEVKTHASCRRSYALLMTDGYYNDSFTIADQDTSDGPSITKPIAYQYRPVGPYSDTKDGTKFANSFADVAMKYWVNDLRPNLDNKVRSIAADEAFWQHMNFYAIGLGINGDLNASDPAVLASLSGPNRTRDWPKPATDSRNSIDDMWHATINGRGKMLNAKTSDELNRSLQQMMATIGADETTQSGVAVSTASLTSNTKKYTPRYTPITWTGNVTAYLLDSTTGAQSSVAWEVETEVGTDTTTGAKIYKSNMPAAADRKIFVGTGASSGTKAVPFTYADMNTAGLTSAMNGTVNDALVKYLRGDPTNEHSSATTSSSSAIYRGRATRLGDIVNSTPVFVKDTLDLRYEMLPMATPGQSTYRDHVDLKKKRPEGVLFVGANDGMLHGFRDGTATNPGGIETFAYVPNALLPTLNQLADKTYVHRFYVDGPNTETDAYFTGGTPRWANVVIGSTGAGAGAAATPGVSPRTAIFALDVTSLNTSVTSLNASSALWEISSSKSDFSELGYVLSDIQSGPTLDGKWVAIFGNGYESKSCQARLFVVDLETGALIKEINTNKGDCSTAKNGLGGVRIMRNSNQQIIGVYAGDLLGNLWKFSLNDASPSNWKVDLGGSPLFPAGPTQPITAAPAVVTLDSTSVPTKGYIVIAGTGKFYEVSDIKSTDLQTVYGVWDSVPFGTTTIPAGAALTDKSLLVQQTILAPQVINGNTFYSISQNEVDYEGKTMPPRRGWYLDLNNTGQRLVYPMDVLANRFVVVDSISPANISLDPCANTSSGTGYLYVINALTGAGPTEAVLDTNGDGNVTSADGTSAGRGGGADGRNVTLDIEKTAAKQTYVNLSGGSPGGTLITLTCTLLKNCPEEYGTKFKSREWRQLFMR